MPTSFRHPTALVQSQDIGEGTSIWAYAHIMDGVKIGKNCNIGNYVFIETGVEIGDDVTIKNGVQIYKGVFIENSVFVGPNAVFTNDLFPRKMVKGFDLKKTILKTGCTIGANATILPVTIAEDAFVAAGAVVTKDVGFSEMVVGSPARFKKFICKCGLTSDDYMDIEYCSHERT